MFKKVLISIVCLFPLFIITQAKFETHITWALMFDEVYEWSDISMSNIVVYKANKNISDFELKWTCKVVYKFLERKWDTYAFYFRPVNSWCLTPKIWLTEAGYLEDKSYVEYKINSRADLISKYSDYTDSDLSSERLSNFINKNKFKVNKNDDVKTILYKKFKAKEAEILYDVIKYISEWRKNKYMTPVSGVSLPTQRNRVPNTWRPYRSHYTDWIHRGWDFYSNYGDNVRAIDNGVIVRIKRNFEFEDLDEIKFGHLDDHQKTDNLDLLRWSQVWVKTLKWEVAIYSHLSFIEDNISVWDEVKKWQTLWKIWITWIPDRYYKDYHVHLEINKNPHEREKYWKYTADDIMYWDYLLNGLTVKETMAKQYDIFE